MGAIAAAGRSYSLFLSKVRNDSASAMCGGAMSGVPSRSAIVRDTRKTRW